MPCACAATIIRWRNWQNRRANRKSSSDWCNTSLRETPPSLTTRSRSRRTAGGKADGDGLTHVIDSEQRFPRLYPAGSTLWREIVQGPPGDFAFVLNPSDPGLLRSLARLSAADASYVPPNRGSSVAAHVDHLRYGIELLHPIIGVVGDVSEGSLRENPRPTVFYSHSRLTETRMTLFVRTSQPETLTKPAVAAMHAIDPNLAVTKVQTFESALAESLARERLSALVSGGFALSGLLLASLGLYGLLAFLVTERTKEIGVRMALGAHPGRVTRSVIAGGLRLAGFGAAIGIGGALLLLRYFGELLFGVTPYDLSTYGLVLALLGAVAALASYLPARRAARIEPLVALRQE